MSGATLCVGEDVVRIVGIIVRNGEDWMEAESGDLSIRVRTPSAANVLKHLAGLYELNLVYP